MYMAARGTSGRDYIVRRAAVFPEDRVAAFHVERFLRLRLRFRLRLRRRRRDERRLSHGRKEQKQHHAKCNRRHSHDHPPLVAQRATPVRQRQLQDRLSVRPQSLAAGVQFATGMVVCIQNSYQAGELIERPQEDVQGLAAPLATPEAAEPAILYPEPGAAREIPNAGLARSALTLAVLALGAGLITGVVPIPDFDAAPTHIVSPPTSSIEAEPQPLAQMSSNLLRPVQTSELERAIAEVRLAEAEKERLRGEIAAGDTRLAWIVLSDWDAEDADGVLVSAAGYAQHVRLYHRPTTLAVPYKPGVPITLTGEVDGDNSGKITVAVHMGEARVPLSLRLGQTVQVPTP